MNVAKDQWVLVEEEGEEEREEREEGDKLCGYMRQTTVSGVSASRVGMRVREAVTVTVTVTVRMEAFKVIQRIVVWVHWVSLLHLIWPVEVVKATRRKGSKRRQSMTALWAHLHHKEEGPPPLPLPPSSPLLWEQTILTQTRKRKGRSLVPLRLSLPSSEGREGLGEGSGQREGRGEGKRVLIT
jgi:hypothetical protein